MVLPHDFRLLIIEDNNEIHTALAQFLGHDHHIEIVSDPAAGLQKATQCEYDLAIVDLMLSRKERLQLIQGLCRRAPRPSILMITDRNLLDERVEGLDAGADDYLVKPFHTLDLHSRTRAMLRRRGPTSKEIRIGQVVIQRDELRISNDTTTVELTVREATLLSILAPAPRRAVHRDAIAARLRRGDHPPTNRAIDVTMHRLRRRIAPLGLRIRTLRGFGYLLEASEDRLEPLPP